MQQAMRVLVAASLISFGSAARLVSTARGTPMSKAIELLNELDVKIRAEGKNSTETHAKRMAECKDRTKDLVFSITTLNSTIADANETIQTETVNIENLKDDIAKKTAVIAGNEAELSESTKIRENESALFKAEEAELLEIIDALTRATRILERAMENGSSVPSSAPKPVLQALQSLVQGSVLSTADASRLSAMIQKHRAEEDADDSLLGAPDAAVYESSSGSILDTFGTLLDEAKEQLKSARKAEMASSHSFSMERQALELDTEDTREGLKTSQALMAASTDLKKKATSDKAAASDNLSKELASLMTLNETCEQARQDFEVETASRAEELKAIATALAALDKATGAEGISYAASFLQRSQLSSSFPGSEVARMLRALAKKDGTPELSQLASQVAFIMTRGAVAGEDPFEKIKGLISDLITKLEGEYDEQEKCNEDIVSNNETKNMKAAEVAKLTASIDGMSSQSDVLETEIAALKQGLAKLAVTQENMRQTRKEENAEYEQRKFDLKEGLAGVGLALKTLRDFYASAGKDSAYGIIGLLEVVESDFTRDLASAEQEEADAVSAYERTTQQNELEKVRKEEDVVYKTKEKKTLDKSVKDSSLDRAGVQEELDAVTAYLEQRQKECFEKVLSLQERIQRRQSEIGGLKDALKVLESVSALAAVPGAPPA